MNSASLKLFSRMGKKGLFTTKILKRETSRELFKLASGL